MATAVSTSACAKDVKAGLPSSQARITLFRRGSSAICLSPARKASSNWQQNIGSIEPRTQSEFAVRLLPHVIALSGPGAGIDRAVTAAKMALACSSTAARSKINVNPFDNRIALRTIDATAPGACQHHLPTISEAP